MARRRPAVLPLFRSQNQLLLLAELFLRPEEARTLSEISAATGVPDHVLSREVTRLEHAGIVTTERRGRLRMVRPNPQLSYLRELEGLLLKTMGPVPVLREELAQVSGADEVYVFGSWAARYLGEEGPAPADIDVLVIGEPDLDPLYAACRRAADRLGLPVNPVVRDRAEWESDEDAFLAEVRSRPLVPVRDPT